MPDEGIDWRTREFVRASVEKAVDKAEADIEKAAVHTEQRIRGLLGVGSDPAMDELREDIRYVRRLRKAAEARANDINKGMVDGFMKALWGFLTAAALGAATWFLNGGHR